MGIQLEVLGGQLTIAATEAALTIAPSQIAAGGSLLGGSVSQSSSTPVEAWPAAVLSSSVAGQLALEIEQIIDRGLGEFHGSAFALAWDDYAAALEAGIAPLARFVESSPFLLRIGREDDIGRPGFEYLYEYLLGGRPARVERAGYLLRHVASNRIFQLDPSAFRLVDAMDRYNEAPPDERSSVAAWEAFSVIRSDAESLGVQLDEYLASNSVVVPSSIALDYEHHEDGSLSFVPRCSELAGREFATVFQNNPKVGRVYSLTGENGARTRIVLNERQQAVLERMKGVRQVSGVDKVRALTSPESFFDGVLADVDVAYGKRVTGIGELPASSIPTNPKAGSIFDDLTGGRDDSSSARPKSGESGPGSSPERYASIKLRESGGDTLREVEFANASALNAFRDRVSSVVTRGETTIQHEGIALEVDEAVVDALRRSPSGKGSRSATADGKYLLIYTNEEALDESDVAAVQHAVRDAREMPFELPRSLSPHVTLKAHQIEGVRWLARCSALAPDRHGALLADDMGLGKTLQVLVHLARFIESGGIKDSPANGDGAPWRPILIIAPLMLVENETWPREMADRFVADGDVFQPVLTLYGSTIRSVRSDGADGGRETVVGRPQLDAAKLMQYRVVVTTYETVVNYQHSFAQLIGGRPIWSVVVSDEAQRFKMLSTKISHAMKALSSDFHIASTGTPVENRLLDLWNIFDALQPALLGTASDFTKRYEAPLKEGEASAREALEQLRRELHFGTPKSFLIRRTKSELNDLPEKRERRIECQMSRDEHDAHEACLDVLRQDGPPGRHLAVLQRLALLSQHPLLTSDGVPGISSEELVRSSSKLQRTLEVLEEIRSRQDKVIIFSRHVSAQNLLAQVIGDRMKIRVPIINGTTSGAPGSGEGKDGGEGTRRAREGRKRVLDGFRATPGFAVIVLSPFVAGVGLTITEANHVIHYGRWWNPAVEAQATDRAYRIGQQRPVTVYYPILSDPFGRADGATFDEVLDRLLQTKRALAKDFLQPTADEESAAAELRTDLLGASGRTSAEAPVLTNNDIDRLSAGDFEALIAALLDKEGQRAVLTCLSGDGGADVLGIRNRSVTVVQAKHIKSGRSLGADAVGDVVAALDTYRPRAADARWTACIVTSGEVPPKVLGQSQALGVALIDGRELGKRVSNARLTLADVVRSADQRCENFEEGVRAVREAVRLANGT